MTDPDISDIRQEVESLNERVSRLENRLESEPELDNNIQSLADFIKEFDPTTHKERALAVGYFIEQIEGQESFTKSDIEDGYQRARLPLPANMSDVLSNCQKKSWMMKTGSDGQKQLHQLAQDGIDIVNQEVSD